MKDTDKEKLKELRKEYKKRKNDEVQRQAQEVATIASLQQRVENSERQNQQLAAMISSQVPSSIRGNDNQSRVSEVSTALTTIMGGRNERANQRNGDDQ